MSTDYNYVLQLLLTAWSQVKTLKPADFTLENVVEFYKTSDPFISGAAIMAVVTAYCYFMSEITRNYSQVDKLWSLLPFIYAWHFALYPVLQGLPWDPRTTIMAVLATLWGLRLTYNFYRKGGYSWHGEDYRWLWLRPRIPLLAFEVFNLTFIATYQNILIYLFSCPAYIAAMSSNKELNVLDYVAIAVFLCALLCETVADQQQWNYQTAKYELINAKKPLTGIYKVGFITSGLWKYSRHPNFFCEMTIWWAFYLFSVAASGVWLNWTILGTFLLSLLFQGSTALTEYITLTKYPAYAKYQKAVSRLVPWFSGKIKFD